jgi:hypothetical protein
VVGRLHELFAAFVAFAEDYKAFLARRGKLPDDHHAAFTELGLRDCSSTASPNCDALSEVRTADRQALT